MDAAGRRRSQSTTSNLSSLVNSTKQTPLETHVSQFAGDLDPALSPSSGQSVPRKKRPPSPQDFLHPASGPNAAHQQTDLHQSSFQADQPSSFSYPADSGLTYNIHFNPPLFSLSSAIQYAAPMTAQSNSPFAVGAYNAGVATLSPRVQPTRPPVPTLSEAATADARRGPPTPLPFTHPYSAGYYISTGLTPIYTATQFRAVQGDPFFGAVSHLTPTPSRSSFEAAQQDFAGSFAPLHRPVPIRYNDQASIVMAKPEPVRVPVSPESPVKNENITNKTAMEPPKVDSQPLPATEGQQVVEAPAMSAQEKQVVPQRAVSADGQHRVVPVEQRAELPRPPVTASTFGAVPFEYAAPQSVPTYSKFGDVALVLKLIFHSGAFDDRKRSTQSGALLLLSGRGSNVQPPCANLFRRVWSRRSTALHCQPHASGDPGYQRQLDIRVSSSGVPAYASHVPSCMGTSTECICVSLWRRHGDGCSDSRTSTFRRVTIWKCKSKPRRSILRTNRRRRRRER